MTPREAKLITGVVECLFLVVKSCVLAGEKQWFGVLEWFGSKTKWLLKKTKTQ